MEVEVIEDFRGDRGYYGGEPPPRNQSSNNNIMEDRKPVLGMIVNEVSRSRPEFPPGMAPKMLKLVKVLNELESKLEPLISKPHHEVLTKLAPLERAKVGLMEVYTINSLFWALMRTSGENIDSTLRDDYKVEMARLKETQARLAEVEARSQRQRVDTRVASRMIQRGLGMSRRDQDEDEESLQPQPYTKQQHNRGQHWPSQSANNEYQDDENNEYQDDNNYEYQGGDNYECQGGDNYECQGGDNYEYQGGDNYEYQDNVHNEYQGEVVNEYQDEVDGRSGYQDQDESALQPVSSVKNKKKKKIKVDDSMRQENDMDYQEASYNNSGYQGSDESALQPVSSVKNKKKKKIKDDDSMYQENDMDYQEASYNNSGYQGSGEDSFLPTPPNKIRKKDKKVGKLKSSDENEIPSASNRTLKMKNSKVSSKIPPSCNVSADILPCKKSKKKKFQSNDNSFENTQEYTSEYPNTGEDYEELVPPRKGKKKRKMEEEANTHQSNEDSKSDLIEDDQVPMPVSKKKQKKKKQEANTSQSEISDLLDTSASRISYEIEVEDNRDHSNKGRSWYEQGWT